MTDHNVSGKIVSAEQQMKFSQQCLLPFMWRFGEQLWVNLVMPSKKPVLLS